MSGNLRILEVVLGAVILTLSPLSARADGVQNNASVNCNEPFAPVTADDSPQKPYFEALLNKPQVTLDELMMLWYPNRQGVAAAVSVMPTDCSPCSIDTLYSWGSEAKLQNLQKTMPDQGSWHGEPNTGHTLDTLVSAVGTFGYGDIPVRIKIRKGAVSIYPRQEQTITDGSQVESWSFATPEHYDEIVRDYLKFKSDPTWFGYWATSQLQGNKLDILYFDEDLDGHFLTEDVLKQNMLKMVRMILNSEGRIYYSSGACRNRALEFKTEFPSYIDPFLSPAP